jgi:hypothetical protein
MARKTIHEVVLRPVRLVGDYHYVTPRRKRATLIPGPSPTGRREGGGDCLKNGLSLVQDRLIRKTKHRQAEGAEVGVAFVVVLLPLLCGVGRSIAFNHQLGDIAVEIADVLAELVFPTEFEAA